ncbi:hypothetical protein [Taibaiella helva]|uniref:hypothetical protein n=1 Tax=Taibaiella helva TaxID=2301235 RepID=UPI001300968B|nr:hypothetical protein [Taibaiella helva]
MNLSHEKQTRLHTLVSYLSGCLCLMLPAMYNSYPLVTPDTGGYIENAWRLHVPIDRPISYAILLRIATLSGLTLWGIIVAQTLLLVHFLRRVTQKILGAQYSNRLFFLITLLLGTCTSAGWVNSQVMPDIFSAILLLALVDYYLSPTHKKSVKVYYFIVLWFIIQQHNSHLLIVLALCILARLYSVFSRQRWFLKKTAFLFVITLFSYLSISFFNLWEGNRFRPSASTHIFMMSRMAENGILDQFLKQYCPTEHYSLCAYQGCTGDRQWDFMWSSGQLVDSGGCEVGWTTMEKEYSLIVRRSLTRPKYLGLQLYEALEAGIRQLPQVSVSFQRQGDDSFPYKMVQEHFPREIKEYRTSLQQCDAPLSSRMGFFNGIIFVFLLLTAAATLYTYPGRQSRAALRNWNFMLAMLLAGILANAFFTATFSTVLDRLQTRIFWLLPFACMLFLVQILAPGRDKEAGA